MAWIAAALIIGQQLTRCKIVPGSEEIADAHGMHHIYPIAAVPARFADHVTGLLKKRGISNQCFWLEHSDRRIIVASLKETDLKRGRNLISGMPGGTATEVRL